VLLIRFTFCRKNGIETAIHEIGLKAGKEANMTTTEAFNATPSAAQVMEILVESIDPPAFNSRMEKTGAALRREEEGIEELAESIRARGQQTPITVEINPTSGRYEIVFGSRRFRAVKKNGAAYVKAIVRPHTSEGERIIDNGVENEQRENLTTYEQARLYARCRDLGMKNAEIATKMGKSQSHISNLIGYYSKLPDAVRKEWAASHPVATFDNLRDLSDGEKYKDDAAKVKRWDDLVRDSKAREEKGEKAGKRGKAKGNGGSVKAYNLDQKRMNIAFDSFTKKRWGESLNWTKKEAYQFCEFLIGHRANPPTGVVMIVEETADKK
jgi:ParB/RepB/Spo0J family partition protein